MAIQKRLRPLIRKSSSGYRHLLSDDDIEQTAALAIATAILRFDAEAGTFEALAVPFVIDQMKTQARAHEVVRRPDGDKDRELRRGGRARRFVECELAAGRSQAQALAAAVDFFGVSSEAVNEAVYGIVAVEMTSGGEHGVGQDGEPKSVIARQQRCVIERAMSALSTCEQVVIDCRYSEKEMTIKR